MSTSESITATVTNVIQNGKHGPYAVVQDHEYGSITFSLEDDIWMEDDLPEIGETVHLSKLRHLQSGWRSNLVRRLTPSDLQQ